MLFVVRLTVQPYLLFNYQMFMTFAFNIQVLRKYYKCSKKQQSTKSTAKNAHFSHKKINCFHSSSYHLWNLTLQAKKISPFLKRYYFFEKKYIKPHKSHVISKTNKIEETSQIYGKAATKMINKPICLFFVAIVKHRHVANIPKDFVRTECLGVNVEDWSVCCGTVFSLSENRFLLMTLFWKKF